MTLRSRISGIFNAAAAQLPVIGPHADIEGELLLQGKKPLGWVSVVAPNADPEGFRRELDVQRRLDEAVAAGRLKAVDVIVHLRKPDGTDSGNTFNNRHYCLPGHEKDLKAMSDFNRACWNGLRPDESLLNRDFGDYLGYRKRDQAYFKLVMKYGSRLPHSLMDAVYKFNEKVVQPAYQLRMVGDPGKVPLSMEQAARKGDAYQQWRLGASYEHGANGLPRDMGKAMDWYTRGADNGNAYAQFAVARHYEQGRDVPRDYAVAVKYYRLAAGRDAIAQNNLAELIDRGHGTPQDAQEKLSLALFTRSAGKGYAPAAAALAARYANGSFGFEKNETEAAFWSSVAANAGFRTDQHEKTMADLTPGQAVAVNRRVAEWDQAHPAPAKTSPFPPQKPAPASPA